jgi:glycosyltransferase involved in cell wall biosynthesis
MKILMIAPTPFFSHRGTHIRIFEEARALEKLGHQITIVTYHIGDDIHQYVETEIDVRRIRRWLFWYKKTEAGPDWQKILLNIFLIKKAFYLTRIQKPDIIHCHLHEGILIGKLVKIFFFWRKIQFVSDFHGSLVNEMKSHGYLKFSFLQKIFNFIENKINRIGDVAITSDNKNTNIIKKARQDEKVFHISDGVSVDYYKNLKSKSELRQKLNLPIDKFIVVYTGALIENKGIGHLLEAIKLVAKKNSDIHFVIGGFPANWVRKYIQENNLEKPVTIISPLNYFSLAEVNAVGDVAIDPKDDSTQQASGKILQYMAAGVGIVCMNRPINRIYLGDEAAEFIDKIDGENLAQAILKLFNDRKLTNNLAEKALQRAENFSWSKVGKELEDIYKMN